MCTTREQREQYRLVMSDIAAMCGTGLEEICDYVLGMRGPSVRGRYLEALVVPPEFLGKKKWEGTV